MENSYQNLNPTSNQNQNDAEEIPQDAKLVQLEIVKMRETRQKSLENIANIQLKLKEEQKAVQERQAANTKLEKEIMELQCNLNNEKYQNDVMRKEIGKMREMSKEIGNFCVRNERILQQCSQDKTATVERNEKLKTKICKNLAKLEETRSEKQCEVTAMTETVLSQRKIYEENLKTREDECLVIREKLENSNNELESLKKQYDELLQTNNSCLNNISDTEKENKRLEEIGNHKQKHSDDLSQQMENELQLFEQRKEEIYNLLDEGRHRLQKKETEIDGVQRGIKNQAEYNKNLQEKLEAKIKEIADLQLQNNELDALQKEKQVQLASNEQNLTTILNSKLEEEQNAKALLSEERKILDKTEKQTKDANQMKEELMGQIETLEDIVAELKNKQNNQNEAIAAVEQELSLLEFKLHNLKEELSKWQTTFEKHECNMLEVIASRTAATQAVVLETEKIKTEEQATTTAVIHEMESIKISFDAETAQETDDFEEKQKQLQLQIQMIENDLTLTCNLRVPIDDEFQQVNKECDNISNKIKDQESLNRAFSNIPKIDFEPPSLPLRSSAGRSSRTGSASTTGYASTLSTSTLILPPTGPVKPKSFDELSGSSAEGNVATYQQILQYKREKQRRRQLREEQKLRLKNSATSQSKAPGK